MGHELAGQSRRDGRRREQDPSTNAERTRARERQEAATIEAVLLRLAECCLEFGESGPGGLLPERAPQCSSLLGCQRGLSQGFAEDRYARMQRAHSIGGKGVLDLSVLVVRLGDAAGGGTVENQA